MAMEDLTEMDRKLYEYLKLGDYESKKWSTPDAAKKLGWKVDECYLHRVNVPTPQVKKG